MDLNYSILRNEPSRRYAVAVVAVAVVTIVRLAVQSVLVGHSLLPLYTLAIMAAARFGGRGPAFAATGLSLLTGYFLIAPHGGWAAVPTNDLIGLVLLLFIGTGVAVLGGQLHHALSEVIASAERYSLMVDGVTEYALSMVDPYGQIQSWNPGAERLEGYQAAQVIGRNIAMFYTPEEREAGVPDALLEEAAAGSAAQHAGWRVRKDGTRFWAETTITPLRDRRNILRGYAQLTRDRTAEQAQRAALEEREETIRSLIESASQGIVGVAADGRIAIANAMAERLFGFPLDELLGQPLEILLPESAHDRLLMPLAGFQSDPGVHLLGVGLDRAGRRKDGSEFPVEISLSAIQTPGGPMSVAFINDVTERKLAEESVRRLNADLEQRVRDRTTQLDATNKELEAFCYSVSHDLRSPLRGINGWSLALIEDYGAQLDAKGRAYLDRVRAETQRMGRLIDDLLQLSRIHRGPVNSRPVDLSLLARGVAARLAEAHPGRRLQFEIEPELSAQGDVRLLEIALTNLLANAVKFTGPREVARIEIGRRDRDEETVFFVRDNGVGFDMAFAGALFGAFQRLHKSSDFPGTGIGLATVQRVVTRHGGRIWAEAETGLGATFFFTIGTSS
jgi:PAS domain S-box-containing protein